MLTLLLTASLFITLALGFFVLVAAPQQNINRTFTAFVGMTMLWIAKDLAFWSFHEEGARASWWAAASFLTGIAVQFALLLFSGVFPENKPPDWKWALLLAVPLLIFLPMLAGGMFWEYVGFVRVNGHEEFRIALKPAAYLFGVYNYTILTVGVTRLWRKYLHYRGTLQGQQLGAILLGLLVTGFFITLAYIALPLLHIYWLLPYGSLFIVPGILIYTYAISSFKLFSLQTALDQLRLFPITYKVTLVVAVTGLAGFFLCQLPVAIWSFGWESPGWRRFIVFSAIVGVIPSLIMILLITRVLARPLRDLTEMTLMVAQGKYGTQTSLHSNDEIGVLAAGFNQMSSRIAGDVKRLREINEVLIRTEKLATAGTLATGVAHEVNNPLASISSLVQTMLMRAKDERDQRTLRLMLVQITRISDVLRNLMDFARPKSPHRTAASLNGVITRSLELAQFDRNFKKITVTTRLTGDLPSLLLDEDQMQQVFLNLLLNARDALNEKGEAGAIEIRSQNDAGRISVEICDNGSGIAPENLSRIFDPFFSTKAPGQGTGLGLAVCHSIITAHGGEISVSSNAGGTCFAISFPGSIETAISLPSVSTENIHQ
jgi:signal transduction histidine kinase